jgi:DNA repair exonuclease SbcCD ATPase subunit
MELSAEEVILIRRYLLGEIAEQDRDLIEARLLTDPQYFNQLVRAEEELTDQYVRYDLSQHEREMFENHFMNAPERREDVAFALALHRYVSSEAIGRPVAGAPRAWTAFLTDLRPRWRMVRNASLAFAALLLTVAVAWLLMENARLQRRLAEVGAEREESRRMEQELKQRLEEQRSRGEDLARQLEISRSRLAQLDREIAGVSKAEGSIQTEAGVVSLALFPGLGRDAADTAQTRTAILAPGTRSLRLELLTDHSGLTRYRAEALTAEGALVWSRDALRERSTRIGKAVVITLPVALLTRNSYLVTLSGATAGGNYEKISSYYFEIVRK